MPQDGPASSAGINSAVRVLRDHIHLRKWGRVPGGTTQDENGPGLGCTKLFGVASELSKADHRYLGSRTCSQSSRQGAELVDDVQTHSDRARSTDGSGHRAEVRSVVHTSGSRRASALALAQLRRNGYAAPRPVDHRKHVQISQCGLLVRGEIAGRHLPIVHVTFGTVVELHIVRRSGASIVLADTDLILRNVQAGRVEDVELVQHAELFRRMEVLV